jgi:LDH2 family malate/lactate/ureidoglycolate dehydrogenase
MDSEGTTVTDARTAQKHRRLTPLGGTREMSSHKGYGLAFMVEIFASILPGLQKDTGPKSARAGHFFLALDPKQYRDPGAFESDLDSIMDSFRQTKPLNANQPVLVAGDPEYSAKAERLRKGIPLSRTVIEDIRKICEQTSIEFLLQNPESRNRD